MKTCAFKQKLVTGNSKFGFSLLLILIQNFFSVHAHAQLMLYEYQYNAPIGISAECVVPADENIKLACDKLKQEDMLKNFKINVPEDWNVQQNQYGAAIFMEPKIKSQPTATSPIAADPNITVNTTFGNAYIDEDGLEEYAQKIAEQFSKANGSGSGINVYSKNIYKLPDGRKSLLYYYTYKKNDLDVSCAALVMANEKVIFRVTLTDYKITFDANLEKYFPVMTSLTFLGNSQSRPNSLTTVIWAFAFMLGLISLFIISRAIWARRNVTSGTTVDMEDIENSMPPRKVFKSAPTTSLDSSIQTEEAIESDLPQKNKSKNKNTFPPLDD